MFIGFAIEALLATNIWVLLYNNILRYLDINFPVQVSQDFIRAGAVPEPFEIPLYLCITFIGVIVLYLIHFYFLKSARLQNLKKPERIYRFLKISVLILLTLLFIKNIGHYPMGRDPYPYPLRADKTIYDITLIIYLFVIAFIIIQTTLISKLLNSRVYILITILVIAFLTFEPHFPMVGHDYSYFLGPMWEIAHGKTIYTQASSQYGFLLVLIITLLYKLHLLAFSALPVLVWFFYIIEYSLSFFLIYKVGKSFFLSLLGLFSIITVNYFSVYHLPSTIPQAGPLRWLPLILTLALYWRYKRIDHLKLIFFIGLLSLWVIDAGISLILAYLATLFILTISKKLSLVKAIKSVIILSLSVFLIFITINLIHLILGLQIINPLSMLLKLKQYGASGFGMLPIETYIYFWLVILIYFASIIYFFRTNSINIGRVSSPEGVPSAEGISESRALGRGRDGSRQEIILLSANITLFASIYFVGRSHQHNLFAIAIFSLLNCFFLLSFLFNSLQSQKTKIAVGIILFFIFIIFPAYQRQEVMTEMIDEKITRFKSGNIFKPELNEILTKRYPVEAALINKNIPDKKILILSADDTYLFYLTGKENLMMDNSQITILTKKDIDFSLADAYKTCPKKIVADCKLFNKCQNNNPFTIAFFSIQPQLLESIQKACKVEYKPNVCTNQLCIAVGDGKK